MSMDEYKEYKICIHKPCHKAGTERTYCLERLLIWECQEREKKRRKCKKNGE